jgi:hypothetical protein
MHCCCAAGKKREVTTIYEVVEDADGAVYALPDYQFTYGNTTKYKGPKTASCVPSAGSIPDSNVAVPWTHNFKYAPGGGLWRRWGCGMQCCGTQFVWSYEPLSSSLVASKSDASAGLKCWPRPCL